MVIELKNEIIYQPNDCSAWSLKVEILFGFLGSSNMFLINFIAQNQCSLIFT